VAGELIEVDRLEGNWKQVGRAGLTGLMGTGSTLTRSRRRQFYFVNGRPVREPMLYKAVSKAYEDLVLSDDHPPVFLFLDLPEDQVDVNVHPRKEEIRIHDNQDIFRFVHQTLRTTLRAYYRESAEDTVSEEFGSGVPSAHEKSRAERIIDPENSKNSPDRSSPVESPDREQLQEDRNRDLLGYQGEDDPTGDSGDVPETRVLGQFRETFLVVERKSGLLLVDQHTAHERILYEQYRDKIQGNEPAQYLSVPLTLDMDRADQEILLDQTEQLEQLGITLETFGGGSLVVQTVPGYLGRRSEDKRAVYGILEEFLEWSREDRVSDPGEDIITIMACRSAVMRGDRLMPREMEELLNGWQNLEFPGTCPHGRNIFKEITNSEIAGWFQRPEEDVCAN